jgi:E3 ubiquitin-protein ligase RNF14
MDDPYDEREEELSTITAIYPELVVQGAHSVSLDLPITPSSPLLARFVPQQASKNDTASSHNGTYAHTLATAHVEHDVRLSHLPSLTAKIELPDGYPSEHPPVASLGTDHDWLPTAKLKALEDQVKVLWEEYGRCQILYTYIDHLQQAAESGFDLDQSAEGCLTLPMTLEQPLVDFDKSTKLSVFNEDTYDCGICLEPKKGASCYKLERCGHVFCRQCLQDFYNNAIKEGDIATVRCLDPSCGKDMGGVRQRKVQRPLHPRELLAMGIDETTARRYVEMKRKKRLESDKNTIYCPRDHCKHPARSSKYPPVPENLADYPDSDSDTESSKNKDSSDATYDPNDRLAICENPKCRLAFCRVCYKSWHGPLQRCHPRDPTELSAEEKASYDYIAKNTSPCPYCNAATSKTQGCNHMRCYQCNTHFCYLCGDWLSPDNPYQHFNRAGMPCYQRLWDMEGGDNGEGNAFVGARHWEQMAREAAREADEADARALQAEEDARAGQVLIIADADAEEGELMAAVVQDNEQDRRVWERAVADMRMANLRMIENPVGANRPGGNAAPPPPPPALAPAQPARRGRGRGNPFRPPAANGQGAAVRAHERGGRGRGRANLANGAVRRNAPAPEQEHAREEGELRRFVELALNDEEEGWDSDELGEEEEFVIR